MSDKIWLKYLRVACDVIWYRLHINLESMLVDTGDDAQCSCQHNISLGITVRLCHARWPRHFISNLLYLLYFTSNERLEFFYNMSTLFSSVN